ncbi:hypothetical protein [Cryobacterium sp. PH31-O1]|uniref:hypothetical protein n=1 Tax=Cryobacterium sp. PH31-O1 TaxID=3046306 RepID=UPI0024BAD278|nr:hypothetical protein [Cryobacterium sp. PH31-O1]MDJ0338250.1 hypothetical protein [Cryobacterium sp. PH31-O1]
MNIRIKTYEAHVSLDLGHGIVDRVLAATVRARTLSDSDYEISAQEREVIVSGGILAVTDAFAEALRDEYGEDALADVRFEDFGRDRIFLREIPGIDLDAHTLGEAVAVILEREGYGYVGRSSALRAIPAAG